MKTPILLYIIIALSVISLVRHSCSDNDTQRTNVICYDTVKVVPQPVKYDTAKATTFLQKCYIKLDKNRILEEDALTFDYQYKYDKKKGYQEIGYNIPFDTTIAWKSKNKDTIFYLTLRKSDKIEPNN